MSEGSIRRGLRAALLLARGRPEGMDLVIADSAAAQHALARHSFLAVALCLPVFLLVQVLSAAPLAEPTIIGLARELVAFLLGWLGFALLSHRLASVLGRAVLWPRFITLWNWCNLVQYLMLGASVVPGLLGMPAIIVQTVGIAAMGWAVWLEWFATRLALGLPGTKAAALVAIDLLLGIMLLLAIGAAR